MNDRFERGTIVRKSVTALHVINSVLPEQELPMGPVYLLRTTSDASTCTHDLRPIAFLS